MSVQTQPTPALFDRWAQSYDTQPNPLLQLEDGTLPALVGDVAGKHILDIGCGTGRWLERFEAMQPASLTGVDCSAVMLQQAAIKLSNTTVLHRCDCLALPVEDASIDLILCSFTLSYISDIAAFVHTCARVLRPGGILLLSDMHPVTAAARQWTRTFHEHNAVVEIAAHTRPLAEIAQAFTAAGIPSVQLEEPAFGLPERPLFAQAGKLSRYEDLIGTPAIYLMKLRKPHTLKLENTRWSSSASEWHSDPLTLQDASIATHEQADDAPTLDLSGYVVLPGLINAHDHLEFALFPHLGRQPHEAPYSNAAEWAHDIHLQHADTIAQHRSVPLKTRLWWGAIRNLLCGVTTVCHHNPLHAELAEPAFPVRVLRHFGWAHSLAFDVSLEQRCAETPSDRPFILHAAEGVDDVSHSEIFELQGKKLLSDRTVLVHGLALDTQQAALLHGIGASLILCPSSNRFLFHRSIERPILDCLERIAIGSDSPLTATGDLLDELHLLHAQKTLTADELYATVTTAAASILRLGGGEGRIAPGNIADLIVIRDRGLTPAQTLVRSSIADIELVLLAGRVHVASPTLYARLSTTQREGLHALEIAGHMRYVRAPLDELFDTAESCLGHNQVRVGHKEVRRVAAL